MNQKPISDLSLDDDCVQEITDQYIGMVFDIASGLNIDLNDVHISKQSLMLALSEAKTDLEVMSVRRKPQKGISEAKIAGILAFRLSRFAPVNLVGSAIDHPDAIKINDLAALALALKAVLLLDIKNIASDHATKELQYTLARRHMNQETLGLAFELLSSK